MGGGGGGGGWRLWVARAQEGVGVLGVLGVDPEEVVARKTGWYHQALKLGGRGAATEIKEKQQLHFRLLERKPEFEVL
ncbi:uncharacterized protein ACA1_294810, partial [Acanthamoeba castellanii str. Neff]